jgi:endonuclease YncB( thermonuclease family)
MQLASRLRPYERRRLVNLMVMLALLAVVSVAARWLGLDRPPPQRAAWSGSARVIDGDSIVVDGSEVRLKGIDAPEGRQTCQRDGREWPCGEEARRTLQKLIGGKNVSCRADESDQHGRNLAVCIVEGRELNRELVRSGYALSYPSYKSEEQQAKAEKRGLWSGEFERPREWRRQHGIGQ